MLSNKESECWQSRIFLLNFRTHTSLPLPQPHRLAQTFKLPKPFATR